MLYALSFDRPDAEIYNGETDRTTERDKEIQFGK